MRRRHRNNDQPKAESVALWGSVSVIDLFLVNPLTLVTEFIGIGLPLEYLGIPRHFGVCASAAASGRIARPETTRGPVLPWILRVDRLAKPEAVERGSEFRKEASVRRPSAVSCGRSPCRPAGMRRITFR
ncbi:hypothetical protein D9M70_505000 [compost metagenome]